MKRLVRIRRKVRRRPYFELVLSADYFASEWKSEGLPTSASKCSHSKSNGAHSRCHATPECVSSYV